MTSENSLEFDPRVCDHCSEPGGPFNNVLACCTQTVCDLCFNDYTKEIAAGERAKCLCGLSPAPMSWVATVLAAGTSGAASAAAGGDLIEQCAAFRSEARKARAWFAAATDRIWLVTTGSLATHYAAMEKTVTALEEQWHRITAFWRHGFVAPTIPSYIFQAPGYFVVSATRKRYVQDLVVLAVFRAAIRGAAPQEVKRFSENPNITIASKLLLPGDLVTNPNTTWADLQDYATADTLRALYINKNPTALFDFTIPYTAEVLVKLIETRRVTQNDVINSPRHAWRFDLLYAQKIIDSTTLYHNRQTLGLASSTPNEWDIRLLYMFPETHTLSPYILTYLRDGLVDDTLSNLSVELLANPMLPPRLFERLFEYYDAKTNYRYTVVAAALKSPNADPEFVLDVIKPTWSDLENRHYKRCNELPFSRLPPFDCRGFDTRTALRHVKMTLADYIANPQLPTDLVSANPSFCWADMEAAVKCKWNKLAYIHWNPNATVDEIITYMTDTQTTPGKSNLSRLPPAAVLAALTGWAEGNQRFVCQVATLTFGVE